MSRTSYGNIFSPVHSDNSFEASVSQRKSTENFNEWKTIASTHLEEKLLKEKKAAENDAVCKRKCEMLQGIDEDVTPMPKKSLFVTTRKTTLPKIKSGKVGNNPQSLSTVNSKKTKPNMNSTFLTSKHAKKDNELPVTTKEQINSCPSTSSNPNLEKNHISVPVCFSDLIYKTKSDLSNVETASKKNESQVNKCSKAESNFSTEPASSSFQTKSDESIPVNLEMHKSAVTETENIPDMLIQCDEGIEKLIKDTVRLEVSFECDKIRQMIFEQHYSLMRYVDKRTEVCKQNADNCENLLKIVTEVMEENRKLKNIIYKNNFKF